jgi:hypothetical protein
MQVRRYWLGVFLLVAPSLAQAQAARPPESVTVTGTKSREVLRDFVSSFAAPARITGKLVRWDVGICPLVIGLRRQAVAFIETRLREIATRVGAPVDTRAACKPNIEIAFTTTPQGLMDWMRQKHPGLLGTYDNNGQLEKLATVTRPIQAWYATATRDYNGSMQLDEKNVGGGGLTVGGFYFPDAKSYAVSGSRLGDGLSSGFHHVTIAIEPNKMASYEMGSLADYIALLALTQLRSLDTCQPLPSIVNMLAQGCGNAPSALTENDVAYLKGLYRMSADKNLGTQTDEVAYGMEQELKNR